MSAAFLHAGRPLADLFPECPAALRALRVTDLALRSGDVSCGALFLAVPGRSGGHGLEHVAEAVSRGAAAVAWEASESVREAPPCAVPSFEVSGLARRAGEIADRFYGSPSASMTVTAVTGTNGKTTVAWLVASALDRLGTPCAYRGTLGGGRIDRLSEPGLTTPDAVTLHRWLAAQAAARVRFVAIEASSHALDQGRLDGVRVKVAVFTNLTPEHLDYHGTMQAYGQAKALLFRRPELCAAVVCCEDAFGPALLRSLAPGVSAVCVNGAAHCEGAVRALQGGMADVPRGGPVAVESRFEGRSFRIESRLIGRFNATNLLLAHGALIELGVDPQQAAHALSQVEAPAGRMQTFGGAPAAPLVVVDFAHTPDALERALQAVRESAPTRVTCVFGCGGERDRAKRPLMGEVAARLADRVILTNDNPRGEEPARILAEIRAGIPGGCELAEMPLRRAAIHAAVTEAVPGEAVLIAGRGHEQIQLIGDLRIPLDDAAAARCALEARA